jgi:hypothetical protein
MKTESKTDEKINLRTINRELWRKKSVCPVFVMTMKNKLDAKRHRLLIQRFKTRIFSNLFSSQRNHTHLHYKYQLTNNI